MFLLIDNYDSFTYNLVQAFHTLGYKPKVMYNDDPSLLEEVNNPHLSMVCISPGPSHPANSGYCLEFLKKLNTKIPVLGICLGHQILSVFAGARVDVAPEIMHGKQSEIIHNATGIFKDLAIPMQVGRYHSLVAYTEGEKIEIDFTVTARGPLDEIMAIQYNDRPWVGIQFHPESVLTPEGLHLLANFPQLVAKESSSKNINEILEHLAEKKDLTESMASHAFTLLMNGQMTQAQAGAFLLALRMKGESSLELAQAMKSALASSISVEGIFSPCIDIVGTGGDGRNSFNCSTLSALTIAGMGYQVVKHGNRAVSSTCGSADALEALGIELDADPNSAAKAVAKRNFAFLFAPHFHPAFKNIGAIRKELGIRTLFNILGPMINPARPSHLLMGVARPELVPLVANALLHSTTLQRAAIVCGAGNYDEVTPIGISEITLLENGKLRNITINPENYGIKLCTVEDLAVHTKEEAISVLKNLIQGKGAQSMLDMTILNVGLALYLLEGKENFEINLENCMSKAREAVLSGVSRKVLEEVSHAS